MYSAALQRYYNEHEHLPYTFYAQPKRFTQYAIEKRGRAFGNSSITISSRMRKAQETSLNILLQTLL